MPSTLWKQKFYVAPISSLRSVYIREYDISKADISVFYSKGVLSEVVYNQMKRIPSLNRNINMGLLQQQNPELKDILKDGIEEARRNFMEANGIEDSDILSIKNDAIFLINRIPKVTKFGIIEFKEKNLYNSFYRLGAPYNLEFYYYYDAIEDLERLEVKGISEEALVYHKSSMVLFLMDLFHSIEVLPLSECVRYIDYFYNQYINKELPMDYYRRFDSTGSFDTDLGSRLNNYRYRMLVIAEDLRDHVDITYNANLILELYRIVSALYLSGKK